ncbi:uncharacterized protein LOC114188629 [Vigna unguiculata]|uniref:uncharacterized protein LOC114188629 n=1 Tax=Vigna unguiculata TaxID=3917 RepID=UPI001015FEF7|nr:uncharacterized protein LOC114188629 [Vigna unguiculata]
MIFYRYGHCCKAKFIGALNEKLTVAQKEYIASTPFWWFAMLKQSLKISRNVLSHLCCRWVERRGGFDVGGAVVEFSLLDVCLGLGLRVVGEKIDLNEEVVDSETWNTFGRQRVDVKFIYDFLMKFDDDVGDVELFCKLYVVLGISEFLLGSKKGCVFPVIFKVVDDMENIGKYNWGTLVYEYLVFSLCSASLALQNEPSRFEFYVVGCAYLLELWSFDHLVVCQSMFNCKMNLFPRLLYWMNVSVGDKVMKTAFDHDMAIVDVAVSKEELDHAIVREAFEHFGTEFKTQELKDKEELQSLLEHHEAEIADLEQSMSALDELVANWKGQQQKDEVRDEVGDDVFIDPRASVMTDEKDDGAQQSNMYDRMKARPRRRFKSVATKTPYSVYGKNKLKSLQIG